ncbi:ATPase, T2SS/T4P/T4SS family [Desulfopila sp. IMCC35008]|uniref:ATPase, T2SS/T4P/T4SS family n=1 Tax=Desulfopila sp. IMCC35008 TaxID=2653858 RepID=UPI0013D8B562|nr:ATPase, T2SS/T4P/T4SS family [Desulfopila sp. IMCC35008]
MSVQSEKSSPDSTLQSLLEDIQEAQNIKSIKRVLRKQIQGVFQVEMAAIFLVDKSKQKLVSWLLIPGGSTEKIVVPIETNSIVGYAASKKKPVAIRNPYDFQELRRVGSDLSFSDSYDKKANVRSKQILAVPIVEDNTLIGVFQLINKKDDTDFTYKEQDEANKLVELLATAFFTHGNFAKQAPPKYESLLMQNLLSRKDLDQGLSKAAELGEDPETVLMRDFQIPKRKMGELLAEFYSTSFTDLEKVDNAPRELFRGINTEYFENEELVPLNLNNGKLIVAAKNIEDQSLTSTIRKQVPKVKQVELVFAFQEDIRSFWKRTKAKDLSVHKNVREKQQESIDTSLFDLLNDDEPQEEVAEKRVTVVERIAVPAKSTENSDDINDPKVAELLAKVIERGYSTQASHIHIEPYGLDENGEVRYRIDGTCSTPLKLSQQYAGNVVDRIKFLASLKRDEHIRPQVGTFKFITSKGKEIELRVTTIPTANSNEDIVLSISPATKPLISLDKILPFRLLPLFKELIEQQQGIILIVGPSASGKTTTLHSALAHINTTEKKIWTAEYPVEIKQRRVRQVQVDPLMNYTYADALRAFLRADSDVIMIGDMQDPQTAVMAVDAALNGHLLLSTLPANSAAEGIIHCLSMGIAPTHLATALHGVLAQRLVRTLCEHCKVPYHPGRDEYDLLFESYGVSFFDHINVMYSDDLVFYRANGCPKCDNSGYHGKKGLYELLVINPNIRKLIMKRAPFGEITEEAMINDMTLLLQEGIQLIFEGITDCKELRSVCSL